MAGNDPQKDEIAKRHAIALCRYLSNCNGEPQLIQLTEAFRSALTDYEALRETTKQGEQTHGVSDQAR